VNYEKTKRGPFYEIPCIIRYISVTARLQPLWKIAFFLQPKLGRWSSDIYGTEDTLQQHPGFLFPKKRFAFICGFGYKVKRTPLKHSWSVLSTIHSVKYVNMQKNFCNYVTI